MSSILIKNVQLIDGTGQPAYKSDVLIKGDKISAIGHLTNYQAEEIIDGMGVYLTPGFIDISNAGDKYLTIFQPQYQKHLLTQGITTIIVGHSGLSLAPLFYGALDFIKPFSGGKKINVNWHQFSEFAVSLSKMKIGVNFGSLIGSGTIYNSVIKEKTPRSLEANEEKIMYRSVEKSLAQGAFGVSFNLDDLRSKISYYELKKITEMAKNAGKICSIYFDKNNGGAAEKIRKIIHLGKETSSHLIINELTPVLEQKQEFEQLLEIINESRNTCNAFFTIAPCPDIIKPIKNYLPSDILKENAEISKEILKEKKKEILKHLAQVIKTGKMTIVSANNHSYLIGRTLREFSHHRNLSLAEGFLKLMEITGLLAEIASPDADSEMVLKAIQDEKALIATGNLAALSCQPFKKFLTAVQKKNIMPLEKAVSKITLFPARLLNLKNRGEIKIGYFADLALFKEDVIKELFVNGRRAIKNGVFQNAPAGKFLRSSA